MKEKKWKIGYLGGGTWGFCLASLLASNGHDVTLWNRTQDMTEQFRKARSHPKLGDYQAPSHMRYTSDLEEAVKDAEVIVESITSAGIRPLFETVLRIRSKPCPIVLTSKGIEQNTGLLLPEVLCQVLDQDKSPFVGALSGPSHAEEVIKKLPTSVVCSAYDPEIMMLILQLFTTPHFRVYPNSDILGVSFGGAMKNIIAIACGISDGLGFGDNTKAALMTRGLHEIRKLSVVKGSKIETLNGLSGMGDLCVTCLSSHSRNFRFGKLIAEGYKPKDAKAKIGMAVEGAYTALSAMQLAKKHGVPVPITEAVHSILYEDLNPKDAVKALLQRAIKEEHL
ncbi:MAG TPA: NAD(P)H-dependent glycerol-3-phosphate dehydrogenase [Chlamydiales bacterium]|nr:NAD(P)H-dependent glycerol-3-phosphate dehydrogenase [Chlamydiales bacterium]